MNHRFQSDNVVDLVGDPRQIRALVVDGNMLSRTTLVAQLRAAGIVDIHQLSRAEDALRKLELNSYDLVVCEYHFHKSQYTGRDLLDDLRHSGQLPLSTTFVMISSESSYHKVAEAAEAALDSYVIRPYAANGLLRRIASARFRKQELKSIFDAIESDRMEEASRLCLDHFDAKGRYWLYTARMGAEISLNLGQLDVARRLYTVVTQESALPWARLGIARVQGEEGQLKEAKTTLDKLIEEHQSYADAYDVMADIQMRQGEMDAAFATYQMACKLTPAAVTRLQKAGLLAQYTGRQEEAEHYIERAMSIGGGSKVFDPISSVVYAFCKYRKNDEKALLRCAEDLDVMLGRDPEQPRLRRFANTVEALLLAQQRETSKLESVLEAMMRDVLSDEADFEAATNIVTLLGLVAERASNKAFADRTLKRVALRFASSRVTLDVLVGSSSLDTHKQIIQEAYQAVNTRVQAAIAHTLEGHYERAIQELIAGGRETGNPRFWETADGSLTRHAARVGAGAPALAAQIEAYKARQHPKARPAEPEGGVTGASVTPSPEVKAQAEAQPQTRADT